MKASTKILIIDAITTTVIFAFLSIVGVVLYVIVTRDDQPTVYLHGSSTVTHDTDIASMIEGADTDFGLYCSSDASELIEANEGDVVMSTRADSYNCRYVNSALLTYPLVGASNTPEFIGDVADQDAIFVSNGAAWGRRVEFYMPQPNLGDAKAEMANVILRVVEARKSVTNTIPPLQELKSILRYSGDGERVIDGRYYGVIVNGDRAVEYALGNRPAPVGCTDCGYLPAIYYVLEN